MNKFITLMFLGGFLISGSTSVCAVGNGNHLFTKIDIAYPSDGCSFQASPVNFCDEKHLAAINDAIRSKSANFNGHYILLPIQERKIYFQQSLLAIDTNTGIAYPVPIDFFSGYANKKNGADSFGKLTYGLRGNKVCIEGSIFVYRAEEDGVFCFNLQDNRFIGYHTTYMDSN